MKKILCFLVMCLFFIPINYVNGQTAKKVYKAPAKAANLKGSLQIKTGIVLKTGNVKYVAKQHFYLLTKSFDKILSAELSKYPSMEEWLRSNGASEELINASSTIPELNQKISLGYLHGINCIAENNPIVSQSEELNQKLINIPEFKAFCSDCDKIKRQKATFGYSYRGPVTLNISDYLPIYLFEYSNMKTKNAVSAFSNAQENIKSYIVAECETSFNGECTISNIKPGKYYLTSGDFVEIGPNNLFWNIPVTILPKINKIELSNYNVDNDVLIKVPHHNHFMDSF